MLADLSVKITWGNRNKKHFESMGYIFTKIGDIFEVRVTHLKPRSKSKIKVFCDYCGKKYFPTYDNYLKSMSNPYCSKDCCKKCSPIKHRDVCLAKYGVDSTNQLEEVLNKKRKKLALNEEFVREEFLKRDYIMIGNYLNSNTPIEYICKKHENEGLKKITYAHLHSGKGCLSCAKDRNRGENNHNWKGGITSLNNYLRSSIKQWTFDSLKNSDFKCEVTNVSNNLVVHHIVNFSTIVKETMLNLSLEIEDDISKYSADELKSIRNECLKLHYHYGLGIVLNEDVHKEFHKIYGKTNNTYDQFLEFKLNRNKHN